MPHALSGVFEMNSKQLGAHHTKAAVLLYLVFMGCFCVAMLRGMSNI
jgi:hypothetical protein